jgi:prophage antirepressor-like protein
MTPQTQLTISEFFEGKEVRMVNRDQNTWFPLVDLAEAWGTNRKTLDSIVVRNGEIFEGHIAVWNITYPKQNQLELQNLNNYLKYVNEQGLYMLMGKLIAGRLKNPEAKERIIRFQRKVPELLRAIHAGEAIVLPAAQDQMPLQLINEYLDLADTMIKRADIPKEIARSIALTQLQDEHKINVQPFISYIKAQGVKEPVLQLTEAIPEDQAAFQSHFSRRKIAEFLKLTEDKTRDLLEGKNIICFRNGMWELTGFGQRFGKVFYVTPQAPYVMAKRAQIKYNPDLLKYLKGEGFEIPETRVKEDGPL